MTNSVIKSMKKITEKIIYWTFISQYDPFLAATQLLYGCNYILYEQHQI